MVRNQIASGRDYRNHVIAGWTGPAQVQKGVTEPAGYTELDLAYIEMCSARSGLGLVSVDLGLLWQTVKVMAKGEGLQF
jgi:lipopolysaccharide/colanic/teichoic acid biosynthesis glycosyltransferase